MMDERTALVALSLMGEPGDRNFQAYIHEYDTAADAFAGITEREDFGSPLYLDVIANARYQPGALDRALAAIEQLNITVVTPLAVRGMAGLPQNEQPTCLFVQGDVSLVLRRDDPPAPALAVVGARAATGYGERVTTDLVAWASELKVGSIVSGAAYGIDGTAHRSALAVGVQTVAVLAGGLDRYYPSGHQSLIEQVGAHGALVSELPPGFAPTRWRFLQRNRLIAMLSDAMVVVEAGARSGSLNAAAHAQNQSVPLGAVPGSIYSATSAGTHRLLREFGARAITDKEDLAALLDPTSGSVTLPAPMA